MLAQLLGSGLRAKVLAWMFSHPEERFFVRQLESLLEVDSANLSRELVRLAELGILTCVVEGRQKYYQAIASCPVFSELQGLVVKTEGLADLLRNALRPLGDKIDFAFVFGSMASGKVTANSDVDLMILGNMSFGKLASALRAVQKKTGREVNPTVYPRGEFLNKLKSGHAFLKRVMDGRKIFLVGSEDELAGLV